MSTNRESLFAWAWGMFNGPNRVVADHDRGGVIIRDEFFTWAQVEGLRERLTLGADLSDAGVDRLLSDVRAIS